MTLITISPADAAETAAAHGSPRVGRSPSVVFYPTGPGARGHDHDVQTKARVAQALAELLGYEYAGEFDFDHNRPPGPLYFVPSDTLSDLPAALRLGIRGEQDLFGGVVPYPFVGTKVISHPLLEAGCRAPRGWVAGHGERVRDAVLPGYSVFSAADARRAGERMLEDGPVRIKDPGGVGGVGQWVVHSGQELNAQLAAVDGEALARVGLVLETNLSHVVTHSVGQIRVGPLRAAYYGTQRTTRNHHDHEVYGGSELVVSRGTLDDLLKRELPADVRLAVRQARHYQQAAFDSYAGMFASRCNYDVAQGSDAHGQRLSGVLEQSWRIGGASGAEAAALLALAADPQLQVVRASTNEVYGDHGPLPPGAWVLYDGVDARVGRLIKYVLTDAHGDS